MDREALRTRLLQEQAELQLRIDKIAKDKASRHISKQFDEQSVERENDQVLVGIELEALEELNLIQIAMARIDTDQYDRCVSCGEVISDERLGAIPHAVTCRHCAV